ncbi:MAG: efflux RND transporter periplasmic adaptor subunit [Myxococcota bacterium]
MTIKRTNLILNATRKVLGASLALLFLGVVGCSEEEQVVEDLLPAVSVVPIVSVDLEEEIRASGELKARFHTVIAAEVAGRVTGLTVDEGGEAAESTVVIELDPQRRKLDLAAARARLSQAKANSRKESSQAARIRKLRSESVASIQKLEEAETMLLLAESSVRQEEAAVGVARRAVSDASVSAPFSGVVARRHVELGEFVQVGTPLFELVSLNPMEAEFSLTELDTERVRVGQVVTISVGAFRDQTFEGKVSFVAPTVDPSTRTLRIKADVDNAEGLLRPGLFARVSLGVDRRENILMVPEEAILQRAGGASVYLVVEDDKVVRVQVETGTQSGDQVEVRGDIKAGDRVVRRGHGGLADGMVVAVKEGTRPPIARAATPKAGTDS